MAQPSYKMELPITAISPPPTLAKSWNNFNHSLICRHARHTLPRSLRGLKKVEQERIDKDKDKNVIIMLSCHKLPRAMLPADEALKKVNMTTFIMRKDAPQPVPEEPIPIDKPQGIPRKHSPLIRHLGRTTEEFSPCEPTRRSIKAAQIKKITVVTSRPCAQKTSRNL
ncbi:hypothetical protein ACE6H2_020453 [Prunus campanulata]